MRRHSSSGKILQVFLILLACVAALGGAYLLTMLGPKNPGAPQKQPREVRAELEDLRRRSQDEWETFSNLLQFKKELAPEDIELLENALRLREEYALRAGNQFDPTLDSIRARWQALKAEEFRAQSFALEKQADQIAATNDYPAAEKLYAQAEALEQRIGTECPLSQKKDFARIAYLDRQARIMRARPIQQRALQMEKEAASHMEKREWETAAEKYQVAYLGEKDLRENYLGILPVEYARLGDLQSAVETARSAADYEKISHRFDEALALAEQGSLGDSEPIFAEALAGYNDLQKKFPRSRYAAKENAEALLQKRNAALSAPVLANLSADLAKLDQLIRDGKGTEAGNQALLLQQQASQLRSKFPDSNLIGGDTYTKLQYISFKSRDIQLVQNRFLSLLKPLPDSSSLRMSASEIPQVLYSVIMENNNPSATLGATLPVDSVSYEDAAEFCRRLSWLTGREVRLPTAEEHRRALGEIDHARLASQVWSIENSGGKTHSTATAQPNAHGFHDLLGNVSEWLLSSDPVQASFIGGDCQTGLGNLASVPVDTVYRRDKSRLRGFRVIVDDTALQGKK